VIRFSYDLDRRVFRAQTDNLRDRLLLTVMGLAILGCYVAYALTSSDPTLNLSYMLIGAAVVAPRVIRQVRRSRQSRRGKTATKGRDHRRGQTRPAK
jgi:hypothetical protein